MSLNRSSIMHSSRMSPFQNKRSRQILQREDTLNLSPILNETSIFRTLNDTSLRQALDESSILQTGTAGNGLNEAYFEIIQTCKISNVKEVLTRLSNICLDSLDLVEPWKRYNAENYWLAEEGHTWKLLNTVYEDSLREYTVSLDKLECDILSQFKYMELFLEGNAEVRLMALIVKWLEKCAAYQEEATKTSVPVTGNFHWSNTLHHLLIGTTLFNKEKSKSMITCMDPDAPKRQKKVPHSDDQGEDDQLCKRVFTELRCGKYDDAMSLCVNAGQPWRAAVLQGCRLPHYEGSGENLSILGNPSRDLWRWCCLDIVNDLTENIHYRATLGILCGHIGSTIAACHGNWKDLLWAHLKVQIKIRVDKFLCEHHATAQANTTPSEVLELLETEQFAEEHSLSKIFNIIHALMDGKKESDYQKYQKSIMLGEVRQMILGAFNDLETADDKLVRFLAHLVLVLRHIGKEPDHEMANKVIEKYVMQLIDNVYDAPCPHLIAYYTSMVSKERQIELYSTYMDNVHSSEARHSAIQSGVTAEIDVNASVRKTLKKVITEIQSNCGLLDSDMMQAALIENNDPLVVKALSALEWLSLTAGNLEDTLWLSNAMIRTFLFLGNSEAASSILTRLYEMFPDVVSKINRDSSELREYLCLKTYLDALERYAIWLRHFESGQPREVEPLPANATFSDKVLHEQRVTQFEQQKTRWQNAVATMSKDARDLLYSVLQFPEGWMVHNNEDSVSSNFNEEEKAIREKEMSALRFKCIPECIILILKILQSSDDVDGHKEALKLSEIISDDNKGLYKVISKLKLAEILQRFKVSSLYLLERNLDMFGYEVEEE